MGRPVNGKTTEHEFFVLLGSLGKQPMFQMSSTESCSSTLPFLSLYTYRLVWGTDEKGFCFIKNVLYFFIYSHVYSLEHDKILLFLQQMRSSNKAQTQEGRDISLND